MKKEIRFLVAAVFLVVFSVQEVHTQAPVAGVEFTTNDTVLQKIYDRAEKLALENVTFYGGRKVMIEGAHYRNMWLETQPMGGYMYAKRDLEIARNNIEIFIDYQREDGRFPGVIYNRNGIPEPNYCQLQGLYLPRPAYDLYFLIGKDTAYLGRVYRALEKFDAYLWRTRDSDNDGCLESWCIYDTGEDHAIRYNGFPNAWSFDYPPTKEAAAKLSKEELAVDCKEESYDSTKTMIVPIESMDVMSYSYSCRDVLSLISAELRNGQETYWRNKALEVRAKLKAYLWDKKKYACYDRDRDNRTMPVLLHNNLRCMYFGIFDQEMADRFILSHLLNADEFWTPMPLPSVAANDPSFKNISGNNWSGQPQALTYQRSIRALENYGHYAELTMIGNTFLKAIGDSLRFTQQYDPFTMQPDSTQDGYGPAVLSALEFISRSYGVYIADDNINWSCLDSDFDYEYTQYWNGHIFKMQTKKQDVNCLIDGKRIFTFSKGARVVTSLTGELLDVIGIETSKRTVLINNDEIHLLFVQPNAVYTLISKGWIEK
jgi:hypothetical protein